MQCILSDRYMVYGIFPSAIVQSPATADANHNPMLFMKPAPRSVRDIVVQDRCEMGWPSGG